jgi:hypothetical protein
MNRICCPMFILNIDFQSALFAARISRQRSPRGSSHPGCLPRVCRSISQADAARVKQFSPRNSFRQNRLIYMIFNVLNGINSVKNAIRKAPEKNCCEASLCKNPGSFNL